MDVSQNGKNGGPLDSGAHAKRTPLMNYLKGGSLFSVSDYKSRGIEATKMEGSAGPVPVVGGLRMPSRALPRGVLYVGAAGTGKSTLIEAQAKSVLEGFAEGPADRRVIWYDGKNEAVPLFYGMGMTFENGLLKTLNPFDARSVRWDVGRDIRTPEAAESFAEAMIPATPGGGDAFRATAARVVLAETVMSLIEAFGDDWSLRHLIEIGSLPSDEIAMFISRHGGSPGVVEMLTSSHTGGVESITMTLRAVLRKYEFVARAWDEAIDSLTVSDFLDRGIVLLLGSHPPAQATVQAVNRLFLSRLFVEMLVRPRSRIDGKNKSRTYIFLDEGLALGRIEKFVSLLTVGRDLGVSVTLASQTYGQLKAVYGDEADALLARLQNRVFLPASDTTTAEWMSAEIGEAEFLVRTCGSTTSQSNDTFDGRPVTRFGTTQLGSSFSDAVMTRPLMYPSELMVSYRPTEEGIRCVHSTTLGQCAPFLPWAYVEKIAAKRADETPGFVPRRPDPLFTES